MLFILIAALFSVSVSVALKKYKSKQFDIIQILAFNYVSASVLAYLWLKPDLSVFDVHTPWWLIMVMGLLLPSIFWCLDRSLEYAGLIKTEIAQRISVVITILISSLIYQEQFNNLKILGIILGVIAVIFIVIGKVGNKKITSSKYAWLSLLCVWIGYAVIDLLFKYTSSLGLKFSGTLTLIFIVAMLVMFIVSFFKKTRWKKESILAGLGLGILNFANIAFYLQAHQSLKDSPAIVFAGMNILVVLFGVIAALVIFKEKLTTTKLVGSIFALVAVYLLMQSMG